MQVEVEKIYVIRLSESEINEIRRMLGNVIYAYATEDDKDYAIAKKLLATIESE